METEAEFKHYRSQLFHNQLALALAALVGGGGLWFTVHALYQVFWPQIEGTLPVTMLYELFGGIAMIAIGAAQFIVGKTQRYHLQYRSEPITLDHLLNHVKEVLIEVVRELHQGTFRAVPRLRKLEEVRAWIQAEHDELDRHAATLIGSMAVEIHEAGIGLAGQLDQLERTVRSTEIRSADEKRLVENTQSRLSDLKSRGAAVLDDLNHSQPQMRALAVELESLLAQLREHLPSNVETLR